MRFTDDIEAVTSGSCDVRTDLSLYDSKNLWNVVYERLKNESTLMNSDASFDVARDVRNRFKNRYRDINPYDANRVILDSGLDGDYINASYVQVSSAPSRKYILTQGPMQHTAPHFWLMIWERRSPAIVMLNRILEKGKLSCYPYFPHGGASSTMYFEEVNLCVQLVEEINEQHFTKRIFVICSMTTDERHQVIHLHYSNWPDFGVPCSPNGMLNFLWLVRASGALDDSDHPSVIHCSAGVGRSGAFVLIDLALYLVESRGTIKGVDLSKLFIELRRCRMGIIQTAEQLRFCYCAVIRGSEEILSVSPEEIPLISFSTDAEEADRSDASSEDDDSWDRVIEGVSSAEEFDSIENAEQHEIGDFKCGRDAQYVGSLNAEVELLPRCGSMEMTPHTSSFNPGSITKSIMRVRSATWAPIAYISNVFSEVTEQDFLPSQHFAASIGVKCGSCPSLGTPVVTGHGDRCGSEIINSNIVHSLLISAGNSSNNAVPVAMPTECVPKPDDSAARYTAITASGLEASKQIPVSMNSNTNPFECANKQHTYPSKTNESSRFVAPTATMDPITTEYLEASVDLRERKAARRLRRARMHEHLESIRERMRTKDLERRRWLPIRVSYYLRRFLVENGYIRNPTEAVIGASVILLFGIGLSALVYSYWFSV